MKISDIKKQCSLGLEGNLFKSITITLFYTLINLLAQFFIMNLDKFFSGLNLNWLFLTIQIIINLALFPFSYGLISSLIEIFNGKDVGYTDFINTSLLNYAKIIKLFLNIIIRVILYVALCIFTFILAIINFPNIAINTFFDICFLASVVLLVSAALNYVFALFIYKDDPKKSCKEILVTSKTCMKSHKLKYIGLILSFILWFIIFALISKILSYFVNQTANDYILNLCFCIITPTIVVCQYIFFEDLLDKKEDKETA